MFIFIFSFIFFLSLLELGLRIIGHFYYTSRIQTEVTSYTEEKSETNEEIAPKFGHIIREDSEDLQEYKMILNKKHSEFDKNTYTILCIGDFYTFGGEVSNKETYPNQLQDLLNFNSSTQKFKVINGGACEYNSRQVLKRLPYLIKRYNPDAVVLLVGASNKFNFALYDMKGSSILGSIRSLRIYKMFKIIRLNLAQKTFRWKIKHNILLHSKTIDNNGFGMDGYAIKSGRMALASDYFYEMGAIDSISKGSLPYERAWYYYNKGEMDKVLEICLKALEKNPNSINILCALAHFYHEKKQFRKAAILYKKAYQIDSTSDIVLNNLAYFYNKLDHPNVDTCIKAVEFDPFYNLHSYYNLAFSFLRQSKYDANYVLKNFQRILKEHPELIKNHLFVNYYNFFKDQKTWEKRIYMWLEQDLEDIVKLCKKHNIKLIAQNYPYWYTIANRVLKKVAKKNSLIFVNNYPVFNRLVSIYGIEEYFFDDNHCTFKGHRIMAENIYNALGLERNVSR